MSQSLIVIQLCRTTGAKISDRQKPLREHTTLSKENEKLKKKKKRKEKKKEKRSLERKIWMTK